MSNFNFNKIMLGGRLCSNPENSQTQEGVSVSTFTIAVNRRGATRDQKPTTDFFKITAWRSLADFVYKFFQKGSPIFVVGTIQNRTYTDREGKKRFATEIIAEELDFVDSKSERAYTAQNNTPAGTDGMPAPLSSAFDDGTIPPAPNFEELPGDDDLPF